jgi:hypothetical protein
VLLKGVYKFFFILEALPTSLRHLVFVKIFYIFFFTIQMDFVVGDSLDCLHLLMEVKGELSSIIKKKLDGNFLIAQRFQPHNTWIDGHPP